MDKQEAKFILQSFRPDGADTSDKDFAEALMLAAKDRELGEWLSNERAADAVFSTALAEVEIPESLRQHILSVMHGESPVDPKKDAAMDEFLSQSLTAVEPPASLRDEILIAMENTQAQSKVSPINPNAKQASSTWSSWKNWAAIAAMVMLGAFLAVRFTDDGGGKIASHQVHLETARILNTDFKLDYEESNTQQINHWLTQHKLPLPGTLPESLSTMKHLGCRMIVLPGDTKASLVCFKEDRGGMIHLVIVPNEHIKDNNLPTLANVKAGDCYHCPNSKWNVARWRDDKNTFILLAGKDSKDKKEVLKYF